MTGIGKFTVKITRSFAAPLGALMVAALMASACSTTKPPAGGLARAELGVRDAREAGATETSSPDLTRAAEELERAKQAMAAGRNVEARRFAERAQVDAELAEAKAEAAMMRRAADELQRRVDTVQTEAERESRKPLTAQPAK